MPAMKQLKLAYWLLPELYTPGPQVVSRTHWILEPFMQIANSLPGAHVSTICLGGFDNSQTDD